VDVPVLLRRKANAPAVGTAALVGTTEGGRRRPRGRNQLRDGQPRRQHLALEGGTVLSIDQCVIDGRDGILPDERFGRNLRTEVASARAHVPMRPVAPRPRVGVRELDWMLQEAP